MNILLHAHSMYISYDAIAAISTTVGDFNQSNNDMTYVLGPDSASSLESTSCSSPESDSTVPVSLAKLVLLRLAKLLQASVTLSTLQYYQYLRCHRYSTI